MKRLFALVFLTTIIPGAHAADDWQQRAIDLYQANKEQAWREAMFRLYQENRLAEPKADLTGAYAASQPAHWSQAITDLYLSERRLDH